jgi:uncharacterized protein (DUF2147 family)
MLRGSFLDRCTIILDLIGGVARPGCRVRPGWSRCIAIAACLAFAAVCGLGAAAPARSDNPALAGVWLDPTKEVEVEIGYCGGGVCGRIVWLKPPHHTLLDEENPDPALRRRPLIGLTILWGLRRLDAQTWGDGKMYNPRTGKYYRASLSVLSAAAVRVRAYRFLPLFGETQIWTRRR